MTLEEKARDMRNAIDAMEIAMMGFGELVDLPRTWGEPRHRSDLGVTLKVNCGQVYQVTDALAELTRIINSPEYVIHQPKELTSR
jgi:hypothetical protein